MPLCRPPLLSPTPLLRSLPRAGETSERCARGRRNRSPRCVASVGRRDTPHSSGGPRPCRAAPRRFRHPAPNEPPLQCHRTRPPERADAANRAPTSFVSTYLVRQCDGVRNHSSSQNKKPSLRNQTNNEFNKQTRMMTVVQAPPDETNLDE